MIDGQQKITDSMYLVNKKRDERKTGDGTLGKDDFMKLLITQLQNQDPTNPMKDNEFIAQMAQFSSLEQTMNLAKSFEKFAESQNQSQLIQYNQFVGKKVQWHELTAENGRKRGTHCQRRGRHDQIHQIRQWFSSLYNGRW